MKLDSNNLSGFLVRQFRLDPHELSPSTPLFSSGLLDSFHLLELISHVEQESGIRISPDEISLENLDSIERILGLVGRKVRP